MAIKTLEDIMDVSFIVTRKGISWTWPGQKKIGTLKMGNTLDRFKGKKVYNDYKGTLAFICNGKMYILKVTKEAVKILEENGFTRAFFHIPTASGDGPVLA